MNNLKELDSKYIANTYKRFPVTLVSGNGSVVYDDEGKKYIDLGSGIAVTSFGIADDKWQAAVTKQLSTLQHTSNLYYTEPCVRLAKLLTEKTGMKKVFFGNSGAEANECAIKIARKYAADKKGADYFTIVTLENSFHGRTVTTLAATGQAHYHELFQPLTPGFVHTPANDIAALERVLTENKCAALMIECVQGEGGVIPLDADFVKAAREITEKNDILLIVDEVQTGNGRCGKLYSYMNYGIIPDIVSTAKGLGGGLPIGAALIGEKAEFTLSFGDHGSTFGANPVCCAGAVSIIERIDEALLADVRKKSEFIFESLKNTPGVEAVSGLGLMIGIKTKKPAAEVVSECRERGVLCLTAKDKVRLLPALNIPDALLAESIQIIKEICKED